MSDSVVLLTIFWGAKVVFRDTIDTFGLGFLLTLLQKRQTANFVWRKSRAVERHIVVGYLSFFPGHIPWRYFDPAN